jgi:transcriptional regulator of arginine metabolism
MHMQVQTRVERQRKILTVIEKSAIDTQAALQSALLKMGIPVNQATLSRDIRELGLVKVEEEGAYRYVSRQTLPTTTKSSPKPAALEAINKFIQDITYSGNMIVVRTDSGAASYVAEAIDNLQLPQLLGSVAGDNTVFFVVSAEAKTATVVKTLRSMTQ